MSSNKTTVEFAVGWLKARQNGEEYVSGIPAKGNPAKGKPQFKIILETEDGRQQVVESFAMFFNQNKQSEKAPDVRFVFTSGN